MTCDFCSAQPVTTVPYYLCRDHAAQFYQGLMAFHSGGPIAVVEQKPRRRFVPKTAEEVFEIRRRWYGDFGETYDSLATAFHCNRATIWQIVTNRSHAMTQHPANVFLRKRA